VHHICTYAHSLKDNFIQFLDKFVLVTKFHGVEFPIGGHLMAVQEILDLGAFWISGFWVKDAPCVKCSETQ
jgi:hypothetical protein